MIKFSKKYFNNNISTKSNILPLTKFNSTFEKKSTINNIVEKKKKYFNNKFNNNIFKKSNMLPLIRFNSTFEEKSTINKIVEEKSTINKIVEEKSTINKIVEEEKKSTINKIIEEERKYDSLCIRSDDYLNEPLNNIDKCIYMGQYVFGKIAYSGAIIAPILLFVSPFDTFVIKSFIISSILYGLGYYKDVCFAFMLLGIVVGCIFMVLRGIFLSLKLLEEKRKDIKKFMCMKIKRIIE